jgi:hypothetical protein
MIGHNALCIEAGCREPYFCFTEMIKDLFFLEGLDREPRMSSDLPDGSDGIVCVAHRRISRTGHVGFTSDLHSQKQTTQPSGEL